MRFVLFFASFFLVLSAGAADSVYTSVKVDDCITLDSADFDDPVEIDYYTGVCRGYGPYTVMISGGDLRYGLSLLYRGKEIAGLTKTSAFHDMGSDVVEWRVEQGQPKALIFRISAAEDFSENGMPEDVDLLHVVKLDELNSCTVAVLKKQANLNQLARKVADNIEAYSCL